MAIVSVSGLNTTGVSLANGDTLIVTSLGTLFTETADAVTVGAGSVSMTVLGAVASGEGDAIDFAGTFVDINIGAAGFVGANGDNAFEVDADFLKLRNAGTIQGDVHSLFHTANAGARSDVEMHNTGTVIGDIDAFFIEDTGSTFSLFNSGSVSGRDSTLNIVGADRVTIVNAGAIGDAQQSTTTGNLVALTLEARYIDIENTGAIHGMVVCAATPSVGWLYFTNTGLVNGTVYGTENSDVFRLRGGEVTGGVFGGDGNDAYYVDGNRIQISDSIGTADIVYTTRSYIADQGIEYVYLQGHDAVAGTGNTLNNTIHGNAFDNRIYGRWGNDTLYANQGDDLLSGGYGDDTFTVHMDGDSTLRGGGGTDEVQFFYSSDSQLRIDLVAGTVTSQGASSDSHLISGVEKVRGGEGNDTILGGAGNDVLYGNLGSDRITGGTGLDTLIGQSGIDTLTGGGLNDTFVFDYASEAGNGAGTRDVITDFKVTEIIDLSQIDAVTGAGNNAFTFVDTATLAGSAGRLRYEQFVVANVTVVEGDVNGDGAADFQIELTGLLTLTAANFVL